MEEQKRIEIIIEANDVLNYALHQNGAPLVTAIRIRNLTGTDIEQCVLKVSGEENMVVPYEEQILLIRAGEEIFLRSPKISIQGSGLAGLTERIQFGLEAMLYMEENKLIASARKDITVLAYDEWPGAGYYPELLAAFVMSNHPVIAELMQSASRWLEKWTGNPSLDGYQSNQPDRVKKMAAAVFAAIQEKNIVYAVPPASFENLGQRVRLADTVIEQRLGTCLDLSLLYAACLEAMGLNPLLVMMQGHIFPGVWLMDQSFLDSVTADITSSILA